MSVDKELNLIIRAALKGGKDLDSVVKSLREIEKAIEDQTAAAKRGESAIDQLKASELSLKDALNALGSQAKELDRLEKLRKKIEEIGNTIAVKKGEWSDLNAKIEATGKASKTQESSLAKIAKSIEYNEARLVKHKGTYEELSASLREAGLASDDFAGASSRIVKVGAEAANQLSRVQAAIRTYGEDTRKARQAEKEAAAAAAETARLQTEEIARLNSLRAFKQAITTQRLSEIKVAEDEAEAARKAAAAAEAQARGYKTLGIAAKSLAGPSSSLRDAIRSIVDPSAQARTTLAGIEDEIRKVGNAVSAIKGPVENYRAQVQQLASAQRAIGQQASMVDQFSRQVVVLRQSRAEFTQARAQVLQYAEALRNSTGQNDQLQASLRNAQATLTSAQRNLAAQLATTRQMRDSMREAGLATNDLAGTQGRLTAAAQGTVAALKGLEAANRRYGEATRSAATAHDFFSNSGRTTLSLVQRIRGEVLSLAAAYVGLYGAIGGAQKAIEAFNAKQAIQNQLALTAGNDQGKIAAEYEYIRQQADRLGISFESAARGYAKFSASAKLAGRDSQEIRYIFESFAEVGRVANLSKEELDGVFKALEQIISKGSIQAEELRGQLGDRLFGAFQVAAQSLKDQFPQLDKAMKEGKVSADQLVKIAERYKEIVGPQLGNATQNLAANQARLNSSLFDFKVLVAEQGFADEYGKLVTTLTEFFQSDDGKEFAKNLSDALSLVVQGLRWIVENLETVKAVAYATFTLFASKQLAGFALSIKKSADELGGFAGVMKLLRSEGSLLMRFFVTLNAYVIGWQIGSILREKFVEVRLAAIALVVGLDTLWTRMKYSAAIIWAELPNIIFDALSAVGNVATKGLRTILEAFSAAARGIGKNDLADSIDRALRSIEFRTDRIGSASGRLTREMYAELEKIRKIGDEMADEAINPGATTAKKKGAAATAKPDNIGGTAKVDEKEAEKRLKLKERLENELAAIEARIERNEKDSLTRRLAAIDIQYQKILKDIQKLGGAEGAELEVRLQRNIADLKTQETRRFNESLLKEQEQLQRKLEQIDAQGNRGNKTALDKRLDAVKLAHEQTYREIQDFRERLLADDRDTTPADLMKGRLDAGILALQNLERQKYYEDAINAILEERKAKLDLIEVQEKTGLITATQAREMAAKAISETQPKLEAVVAEALQYVDAMLLAAQATGENTVALDTLKAKLIAARESAKGLRTELFSAAQINEMLAGGMSTAFDTAAKSIGNAIAGVESWKDAVLAIRNAFLKFAADFLLEIGKMILKQTLLNALQQAGGSSGGVGGLISGALNALIRHDGGMVGSSGRSRLAPAAWFANAPRYHGGGIAGLAPDEYPAILRRNEEVLTENDPRHVTNGGQGGASQTSLKIINMIESGSVVSEGLSTQEGTRAFFNFIRANRTNIRSVLA